eukprot:CAMPEP_0114110734 /NCGR_PEP_ID=MMETSP0043_2-20121206/1466_1 /TAXON_ID=464988 /ORGANISM="Hemiselmis andersenii, Strain CCMP644" /LENGTH=298 /DNA_ID=CAMNT_0001202695 /DNA_START=165 /DNA_END=1063 /DNA_ORIENTATION=+
MGNQTGKEALGLDFEESCCCSGDRKRGGGFGYATPAAHRPPGDVTPGRTPGRSAYTSGRGKAPDLGKITEPTLQEGVVFTFEEHAGQDATKIDAESFVAAENSQKEVEQLYGVGVIFKHARDGKMMVMAFVRSSSAYDCGAIQDGDILHSVDSNPVDLLPQSYVNAMLLGEKNSWVQLKFLRPKDGKSNGRAQLRRSMGSPPNSIGPAQSVLEHGILDLDVGQQRQGTADGNHSPAVSSAVSHPHLMGGVEDVQWWAWAPQYEKVIVDLKRTTPNNVLIDAKEQAWENVMDGKRLPQG